MALLSKKLLQICSRNWLTSADLQLFTGQMSQNYPPEVNIEVPSDSDSSRRPSKYTLSNASSMHDLVHGDENGQNRAGVLGANRDRRRSSQFHIPEQTEIQDNISGELTSFVI